jgi:ketosteroid isomerase-like protein
MIKSFRLATAAALLAFAVPVSATPADDAVSAARAWLDAFNAGNMNAFYAGHIASPVIIDEFAPYVWSGPDAPKTWAQGYDADSKAHGITDGRVDYAAPIRAESDGKTAYIVFPTVYRLKQNGRSMSAAGNMTFVMNRVGDAWKIASWAYSAPAPAPDR